MRPSRPCSAPSGQRNLNGTKRLRAAHGEKYHFVLVYVVDPHPKVDVSVYRGAPWTFEYSKYRQATTLAQRATFANSVSTEGAFDEVLVDELQPSNNATTAHNNPTWCGWGPCPNCAWLIDRNGTVKLSQVWFEEEAMGEAMRAG